MTLLTGLKAAGLAGALRCALSAGFVLVALGVAGCSVIPEPQADPTRYYLLASDTPDDAAAPGPGESRRLNLALRVVELPGYLRNNRTMVLRRGANEILYQDYARWAEPIDIAVQRIVRDRLLASAEVSTAQVAPFSTEVKRDFDINVRVVRCEGAIDANGKHTARFVANYEVSDPQEGGRVLVREQFSGEPKSWDGNNHGALAQQLSDLVSALGDEIVRKLPVDRKPE